MEESGKVIQTQNGPVFIERSRTALGPQGDHVTAYALFQEFIRESSKKDPIKALATIATTLTTLNLSLKKYVEIFSNKINASDKEAFKAEEQEINEAIKKLFLGITETIPSIMTEEEINKIISSIPEAIPELRSKALTAITNSNQALLDKIITQAENLFLTIRNKRKYVSFPREGSPLPPKGEGAMVKKATNTLRRYNNSDTPPYEDSVPKIVDAIQDLFWYPKIPEEDLFSTENKEWDNIRQKKSYKFGTKPRDNNVTTLYYVTAIHIDTVASCFPIIRKSEIFNQIIKSFVEQISKNWDMGKQEHAKFLNAVNTIIATGKNPYLIEKKQIKAKMKSTFPKGSLLILNESKKRKNPAVNEEEQKNTGADEDEIPPEDDQTTGKKKRKKLPEQIFSI